MEIDNNDLKFVRMYFVNVYQDPTHAYSNKVITEYFFATEITYGSFMSNIKYPTVIQDHGYRIAIKINNVYHPLCAPVQFTM